jgi:hypothetical protein
VGADHDGTGAAPGRGPAAREVVAVLAACGATASDRWATSGTNPTGPVRPMTGTSAADPGPTGGGSGTSAAAGAGIGSAAAGGTDAAGGGLPVRPPGAEATGIDGVDGVVPGAVSPAGRRTLSCSRRRCTAGCAR